MGGQVSGRSRILFLEDEIILTLTFEDVLQSLGIGEVVTAHSLEEAHQAIDRGPFDIAVLDYNIGSSSSVEVAERIAQSGGKVIFATGHSPDELDAAGFPYDVITKPYQERGLCDAVLLAHSDSSQALVANKKAAGF